MKDTSKLIVIPSRCEKAYFAAADIFRNMYQKVTGKCLLESDSDDGVSDLIIIGSDAVNPTLMIFMLRGTVDSLGIRYGTDDYCIRSCTAGKRHILILAGGRGRSTIYSVYDFFERKAGCHYFWDGDVIPQASEISLEEINVTERPRFEFRGLRYFAHRGLKRFQAEHWSLEDWKQEIDWMLKKRLNMFILRIGMDDLWQRTFPDIVPYPSCTKLMENAPESFDDRSPFWPLEYRGRLREQILKYAADRDLIHLEDCGTMTHWYSRTPVAYLQKEHPDFLDQSSAGYNEETGKVFDIRKQKYIDEYMKLTETSVRETNPNAGFFHTIGLAERNMYKERDQNLRLKLYTYRKIAQSLREKYPNSTLMVGSWDFIGWWKEDEVQTLISELDPSRTMILDYTSDVDDPDECFLNWGIVGRFPWMFGIFHAYEAESTLRGAYPRIQERLQIADKDPYCRGMVFWPELSHSDGLMLEYFTDNAWNPSHSDVRSEISRYCGNRYGQNAARLESIWQEALPIIEMEDWGGYTRRSKEDPDWAKYSPSWADHREIWPDIFDFFMPTTQSEHVQEHFKYLLPAYKKELSHAVNILQSISEIPADWWKDRFIGRDLTDLSRMIVGRYMNGFLMLLSVEMADGEKEGSKRAVCSVFFELLDVLGDILSLHTDHSMYVTLQELGKVCPVNPQFEITLKHNLVNAYCRQYAYEPVKYLYPEECRCVLEWVCTHQQGEHADFSEVRKQIYQKFMDTPLEQMRPEKGAEPSDIIRKAKTALEESSRVFSVIIDKK